VLRLAITQPGTSKDPLRNRRRKSATYLPFILHNQRLCGVTISKVLLKESACVFCGLSINSILTPGCAEQYVNTHGQSEVGFAFCYLLGFALLPRLKNIKKQRLYRPQRGELEK
jgi:hypothetical protein